MKNRLAKRILSVAMACVIGVMAVGCSSKTNDGTGNNTGSTNQEQQETPKDEVPTPKFEKRKIAFATNAVDETFATMKDAFVNEIGPLLNIEFMFSELLTDAGAFTTFVENAYASGCEGVISNLSNINEQAAAICEDLGMYFVGIASADPKENTGLSHFISVTGASAQGYGESYAEAIKAVLDKEKNESILIMSGAACYGATSFIEGTAGSLRALQDVYGLTYEKPIEELAITDVQLDAANDKGIKITIFPGMKDLTTSVSPLLQSGNYNIVVGTTNIYDSLGVAIDEVEKSLKMDIKFISRNTFSDAIAGSFNNKDSQGNPIMNAIVAQGTYENVAAVIAMRNALDGFEDNMRDGANCSRIPGMRPLTVINADAYNKLSSEDMPYSFITEEEILSLCSLVNSDVTFKEIDEFGKTLTSELILQKFSK